METGDIINNGNETANSKLAHPSLTDIRRTVSCNVIISDIARKRVTLPFDSLTL